MDHELMKILACPACRGELEPLTLSGASLDSCPDSGGHILCGLACSECKLVYPVQGDIPVMLKEAAVPRWQWEAEGRKGG